MRLKDVIGDSHYLLESNESSVLNKLKNIVNDLKNVKDVDGYNDFTKALKKLTEDDLRIIVSGFSNGQIKAKENGNPSEFYLYLGNIESAKRKELGIKKPSRK